MRIRKRNDKYTNLILKVVPRPTLSIFIDVSPEIAFNRKGEFTKGYLEDRYKFYQIIFEKDCETVILQNIDYISGEEEFFEKVIKPSFSI